VALTIITIIDFQTLVDVIIVDLTCIDLVQHASMMITDATTIVAKNRV
jgi:hypothetical protein